MTSPARVVLPLSLLLALAGCAADAHHDDAHPTDAAEADAITAASCLFGRTRHDLESSTKLTFGPSRTLTATSTMTDVDRLQLAAGIDGVTSGPAFFASVQGGHVSVRDVTETATGRVFTSFRYSAGGRSNGFLFAKDTAARVAIVSDDSIAQCKVSARAKATSCLFGLTRAELDARTSLSFGTESTLHPTSAISAIRKQQLMLGIGYVATAKDAILATDDDVVTVRTITEKKTGHAFTSYRSHRGDNPMGFVFAEGTLDLVAIDGDESIHQCLVEGPCVPAETAKGYWQQGLSSDAVFYLAASEQDGETYQDPQHRSVHWLAKTAETSTTTSFVGGINDLWAVRFDVSKTTCGLTVTGEH
jgi:hypothetical protein